MDARIGWYGWLLAGRYFQVTSSEKNTTSEFESPGQGLQVDLREDCLGEVMVSSLADPIAHYDFAAKMLGQI